MSRFEPLMNQILSHNPAYDPVFFTTCFVDGLGEDIRAMILLHRPKDLDIAYSLASLQENSHGAPRSYSDREDWQGSSLSVSQLPALPAPPLRLALEAPPSDRKPPDPNRTPDRRSDDLFTALQAYRRGRGLCFKCGEKWAHGHKCRPTVQLQIVKELLEMLQHHDVASPGSPNDESDEDSLVVLSQEAVNGTEGPRTMRLWGMIEDKEVLILVVSGSTSSFLNSHTALLLKQKLEKIDQVKVKVANGQIMSCTKQLPNCNWWVQGHSFHTNLRVLELGCYDMILGMDWLSTHSPMLHDWKNKKMSFNHLGHHICLQGIHHLLYIGITTEISVSQLEQLVNANGIHHLLYIGPSTEASDTNNTGVPYQIQELIQEYSELFQEPKTLSPHRAWYHHIPLHPGTKLFSIRDHIDTHLPRKKKFKIK